MGGVILLRCSTILSTAAAFPVLDAETQLPGRGPVAISGDTAIVGNFVYARTPAGWVFQQTLDGYDYGGLGTAVVDGNTAVLGTNVYIRDGAHWNLQASLPLYGSVAISGDTIASATYERLSIFQRTNSTWTLQSELYPAGETNIATFGASLALDGQTLVVGAPGYLLYGAYPEGSPSVYVFSLQNGSWVQEAKLTNSDPADYRFGEAVAVSGDTIAVEQNDSAAPIALFNRSAGLWQPGQSLSLEASYPPDPDSEYPRYMEGSLAMLQGNTLAALDSFGTAHIFTPNLSTWVESQTLNSGSSNKLGTAISLTTNALITTDNLYTNQCAFLFESQPWAWQEQDVGDTEAAGGFNQDTNGLSISGAGANIGGSADAFHYVYRPYSNDLEMIVHVESIGGKDSYSRGGIMFRGSLDPGAPYILLSVRQGQEVFFEYRNATNTEGIISHSLWAGAPYWLKLRKLGTNLVASTSDDGTTWYEVGSTNFSVPENVSLPDNFYIGLAVTSERAGILATDVFDHVEINPIVLPNAASDLTATSTAPYSITLNWKDNSDNESGFVVLRSSYNLSRNFYYPIATLPANTTNYTDTYQIDPESPYYYIVEAIEPHGYGADSEAAATVPLKLPPPWLDQDVGPTEKNGDGVYDKSGDFDVTGGATNAAVDGLHFVYQQVTGDFDIRAWVQNGSWYNTGGGTKAGLMVRGSLDAASPYAFASMTAGVGDQFIVGNSNGTSTVATGGGGWVGELRIVRKGNVVSVFHIDHSVTDVGLSELGQQTLSLPDTVYIGFAVEGSSEGQPASGQFSQIYVATGSNVHSIVQPVLTAAPLVSGQVQLSWTDAGLDQFYYQAGYVQTNYGNADYYLFDPFWGFYSNATSYVDTSIVPGMTRNYRIKLSLPDGDWIWSNFARATALMPVYNLPPPWELKQVGIGQLSTATVNESNRSFTIWGNAGSLGGSADSLSGIFRPLSGDATMVVHLAGTVDTTGWIDPAGKFGIMIRQSLDSRAPAAAAFANRSPAAWVGFMSRTFPGDVGSVTNGGLYMNTWLKLVRTGDVITGYTSLDGVTWTELGAVSIPMTDPALIGIFAESENGPLASATFDNVQIEPAQAPAMALEGLPASGGPQLKIECSPGYTNWIEVSSDLVHWDVLTNGFNVSGSMQIDDSAARTNASRFYRVRVQY